MIFSQQKNIFPTYGNCSRFSERSNSARILSSEKSKAVSQVAPYLPTFHRKSIEKANSDDNIDNHEDKVDLGADVVSVAWNSPQGLPQNLLRSDQR